MLPYILLSIGIVLGIGLIVRHMANDGASNHIPITGREFLWTSLLVAFLVVPVTIAVSWKMSQKNQMTYVEQWNGWETGCSMTRTKCVRDGACRASYACDPYIVMVTYSCGTSKSPRMCTRPQTRYHQCPYAREEWNYFVSTTLGDYTIDTHRLPTDYAINPWRAGHVAPRSVAQNAGVGNPKFWEEVRDRLRSDSAGPVTKFHTYENYVLASHMTVLKTTVQRDIDEFRAANLLPKIQRDLHNFYQIEKVYAVGTAAPPGFRDAVARLASSIGHTRQGDLRVVLTSDMRINGNPDRYVNSLKAYWQSRAMQNSNHALPKNAVVVVLGTDGQRVLWSRAFTGMPTGNESLTAFLNTRLTGMPYQTDSLVGFLRHRAGPNVGLDTLGLMSYIALQSDAAYERENMGLYMYLKGDIQPTSGAKTAGILLSIILGGLLWLIPLNLHCPTDEKAIEANKRYIGRYTPTRWR